MGAHRYWPSYCEENVWHLCAAADVASAGWAVFISNTDRTVYFHGQKAGKGPWAELVWDYHVIYVTASPDLVVVDQDCVHGPEVALETYLALSFPLLEVAYGRLAPRFRVVEAAQYTAQFCSDRSHMRQGEAWLAPPPPWSTIGDEHNLPRFIDMDAPFVGDVVGLAALSQYFVAKL